MDLEGIDVWAAGAKNAEPNGALPRREPSEKKLSGSGPTEVPPSCACSGTDLRPVLELLRQILELQRQMGHLMLIQTQAQSDDPDAPPTQYLDGTPIT